MPPRSKNSKSPKSSAAAKPLGLLGRLPVELRISIYGLVFANDATIEFDVVCNPESGRINVFRSQSHREHGGQPLLDDDYRALTFAGKSVSIDIASAFWTTARFKFGIYSSLRGGPAVFDRRSDDSNTPKNSILAKVDQIQILSVVVTLLDPDDSEALQIAIERSPDDIDILCCHQQFDIQLQKCDKAPTNVNVTASQRCTGPFTLDSETDDFSARLTWIRDFLLTALREPRQKDLNITIVSVLFLKLMSMSSFEFEKGSKTLKTTKEEWTGMMADKAGRAAQARSWWLPGCEGIFGGWVPLAYDAELNLVPEEDDAVKQEEQDVKMEDIDEEAEW